MIDSQIEYILNDIRQISESMVVKFSKEAAKYETLDTRREGDKYVTAAQEKDTFQSYPEFERDLLIQVGITDVEQLEECYYDKYKIPVNKRHDLVRLKRRLVINEYVEENDYYRELIGLPPVDEPESEYIYLTEEQMDYYDIDEVRPIHDYPLEILIKLERDVIPQFIEMYPNKKYLKRMGSKAVNLVRARTAKNFEIIFSDKNLDNVFLRTFHTTYDMAREYFMSVIYNNAFSDRYFLYDNFIGMHIMIMTIQRTIVNTIKLSIDRDFYDIRSIKKMFDCYGLPYFEDLPLDYQRAIVKNLNVLIRTKSTDKCLYDITNILMYERIKIYKYFLVRERLMDEDGKPITADKVITDDEGNTHKVPDYEKMYDVYFQSTDIDEENVILAIENKPNRFDYLEVTEEDMLWWDDADLKKELYEREFNFIETKYLGINIMYNLTELLYETCYFLNMLVDNKDTTVPDKVLLFNKDSMKTGTDYLYLDLNRFTPIPVSIFDAVVILCALVSKKNGMKGNIIVESHTKVLHVLGFNFEANFDYLRSLIRDNPRYVDQSLLPYLDLLDIKKIEDIEILYNNFRNFADFCVNKIATTENIYEYKIYKELYRAISVREQNLKAFTKSNGEVAKTYLEYLYDKLPHIADMIDEMHKDKLGVYIEHVLGKLNELIPDLEYLSAMNGTNNNIVKAIVSLINFFKSYTTDLRNLNVVYIFNGKDTNMIRMVDDPRLFIKLYPREKELTYNDICSVHSTFHKNDKLETEEMFHISNTLRPKEKWLYEEVLRIGKSLDLQDKVDVVYHDIVKEINSSFSLYDVLTVEDKFKYSNSIRPFEKFLLEDKVRNINSQLSLEDVFKIKYDDYVSHMTVNEKIKDGITMRDSIKIIREE